MGFSNLVSIFFIYLFSLSNLLITIQYTTAQSNYVHHFCSGDNYTANSTFQKNLNVLLPKLSSAVPSLIKKGYYSVSFGQNPDVLYGSLQCRGAVPLEGCQDCVRECTQKIKENDRCPNSKQAIIWYSICMIRYSDQDYFNIMQDKPRFYVSSGKNATNPDLFTPALRNLLNGTAGEVGINNFATTYAILNDFQEVYGLVQCTADISSNSCYQCLVGAISEIPHYVGQGGRSVMPTCNWRYEPYFFFEYTMMTPSPPQLSSPKTNSKGNNSSKLAIRIVVPSAIAIFLTIAFWFLCFRRKKSKTKKFDYVDDENPRTEYLQFNFGIVSAATDNFSEANRLGEGGFGSVYKGTLSDSWQEIAVKRLSKNSGQGEQEFKNEITLVAKLQHRNLVKLVGFSLTGEEKLLIYEFMPSGSLDQFLFDPIKRTHLDWERRYRIIGGVARGLVYLHEESRLKIIHRDLKASNILLDIDMNPKIADFGMARLFVLDQTQASTIRIVGTHGYMAPEYIMHGKFSVKSDVFSFGVLVLEIISGHRNSSFQGSDIARNLLSYAWRLWKNGSAIELLDPTLKDRCSRSEAMKCIHVALLCVQENVADRPTMRTVVQMLNNSVISHDSPSLPGFFAGSTRHTEPPSTLSLGYSEEQVNVRSNPITEAVSWSVNEISVTELYPR